ncbi:MAG: DUF881 domain-containing protein [Bacillota bacterium]|nr:DUF881 domain-containing protein [Bacillota bacterium]
MRLHSWQVSLAIGGLVLGLLVAVQLRNLSGRGRDLVPRPDFYARLYQQADAERQALRKEVSLLRQQVSRLEQGKEAEAALNLELERTNILAGLSEVEGPGLEIVLDSSKMRVPPGGDPELYSLQDEDLLSLINELLAAGAEALAINNERRVAWTEVRRAGVGISVNNVSLGEPFVIRAIGDPVALESALRLKGGVIDSLLAWGIEVTIERKDRLVLPAYQGPTEFKYARLSRKEPGI